MWEFIYIGSISPSLTESHYSLIVDSESESKQDKILNSYSKNNDGSEIFCSQQITSMGVIKVIAAVVNLMQKDFSMRKMLTLLKPSLKLLMKI